MRHIEKLLDLPSLVDTLEAGGLWLDELPEPQDDAEARSWLNQLETILGRPIPHKHDIDGVVSLTNDPTVYPDDVLRPQSDNGHQHPHTDGAFEAQPPVIMAVFCRRAAEIGGETLLVNLEKLYHQLDAPTVTSLCTADAIVVERGDTTARHPVFSQNGHGGTTVRFSNHEYNQSHPGDPAAAPGFTLVDEHLKDPDNQQTVILRPNQLVVIDNTRWAHGRNGFKTTADEPRHLLRKWYDGQPATGLVINTGIKTSRPV